MCTEVDLRFKVELLFKILGSLLFQGPVCVMDTCHKNELELLLYDECRMLSKSWE